MRTRPPGSGSQSSAMCSPSTQYQRRQLLADCPNSSQEIETAERNKAEKREQMRLAQPVQMMPHPAPMPAKRRRHQMLTIKNRSIAATGAFLATVISVVAATPIHAEVVAQKAAAMTVQRGCTPS